MSSLLPDRASAPWDTGERRAERRQGCRAGSGGVQSSGRRRTAARRRRSPRCRGPRGAVVGPRELPWVLVGLPLVLVALVGLPWVLVGLPCPRRVVMGFRGTAVVLVGLSWVLVRLE